MTETLTFKALKFGKTKTTPIGNVTRSVLVESSEGKRACIVVTIRKGRQGLYLFDGPETKEEAVRLAEEYVRAGRPATGFPVFPEAYFS